MSKYDPNRITYFGVTDTRNSDAKFGIKAEDRTRHVYAIGKTGMGKSTLLENMAIQDIQNGEGLAFIDPHGKSAEDLLDFVPEERVKDVLYFAPFDMENPVSFNIMEDIGADKRHLVVSGLMSTFKKIWIDAWSARMEYILQNTLLALLEYPGATLLGVNKMLSDKEYRKRVVDNIQDPATRSFWVDEFAKYTERFAAEAVPAIQNKVGQFTSNPLIRNIIGQPKSSFDLRKMMDEKKIIIVNLSKGLVGEGNAALLGGMLITKIYLAALSRADVPEETMKSLSNFYLYVDEFQSFANEAFADILSEARKYKLNLTMAHQYVEQMEEEVQAAVFGNVGTMIVFRVGPFDAEVFEKEFMPTFVAEDFVNLGKFQMYLKLMIDGVGSQPFSARSLPRIPKPKISYKESVIVHSRDFFGRLRKEAEANIQEQLATGGGTPVTRPKSFDAKTEEKRPLLSKEQAATFRSALKLSDFEKTKEGGVSKNPEPKNAEGLRSALASVLTSETLPPVRHKEIQKDLEPAPQPLQRTPQISREQNRPPQKPSFQSHGGGNSPERYNGQRRDGVGGRQNERRNERNDRRPQLQTPPKEGDGKSLKEALSLLLKKETPQKETTTPQEKPSPQEAPRVESTHGNPSEIPEEKLRKMLEVEE